MKKDRNRRLVLLTAALLALLTAVLLVHLIASRPAIRPAYRCVLLPVSRTNVSRCNRRVIPLREAGIAARLRVADAVRVQGATSSTPAQSVLSIPCPPVAA